MRIISGKFRKKTIFPPKNFSARPTTDMAKESLFNIIENNWDIESLKVLDLFGGTGSISYEFASRGCRQITCVELNYNHFTFIKKTVLDLKIDKEVYVIKSNVFNYLNHCTETFDLIFADPPYDLNESEKLPNLIFDKKLLHPDGVFILEHSKGRDFSDNPNFWQLKNYGSVHFSFFKQANS